MPRRLSLVFLAAVGLLALQAVHARTLTFHDCRNAEEEILRVRHAYRLGDDRAFDEVYPADYLEARSREALELSALLESRWGVRVTRDRLASELDRIAQGTLFPERLTRIYAALDEDPFLVLECFVRPSWVRREAHRLFADDPTIHAEGRLEWKLWWSRERLKQNLPVEAIDAGGVTLPGPRPPARNAGEGGGACSTEDTWANSSLAYPGYELQFDRDFEAIWATDRMIVMDEQPGLVFNPSIAPSFDSWRPMSGGTAGGHHVWTGSEMIAWGGFEDNAGSNFSDEGGRYDPSSNTWATMTTVGAPIARRWHAGVWAGDRYIVVGGSSAGNNWHNDGGEYDPLTDSWQGTATNPSPGRRKHTAIWTGSEMILWGGEHVAVGTPYLDTGRRYDPLGRTWGSTTTTGAPQARYRHSATWTGDEMIVYGGLDSSEIPLATGGRYDPQSDSWTALPPSGLPAVEFHEAFWTGSELIVWIGSVNALGARYNPSTNTWTPISSIAAPPGTDSAFWAPVATWDGSGLLIFGYVQEAKDTVHHRYDPQTDQWSFLGVPNLPIGRSGSGAVWTGNEMIVWGGTTCCPVSRTDTGGRYDPLLDSWLPTSLSSVTGTKSGHHQLWTGQQMIVWGGNGRSGALYDPDTDSWIEMSNTGAGAYEEEASAVWTGSEMLIWGDLGPVNNGARYDPATDTWSPMSSIGAPVSYAFFESVWTGTEMLGWGGVTPHPNTGYRYNPTLDQWAPMSTANAPSPRVKHSAVWTGNEMLIWGGDGDGPGVNELNDGARYDPATDTWTPLNSTGAPDARFQHTGVWTGANMLILGGWPATTSGGIYDPGLDLWTPTQSLDAPTLHRGVGVWTGAELLTLGYPALNQGGLWWGGSYQPGDIDQDGLGNACDICPTSVVVWDDDGDSVCDDVDICLGVHNPVQADTDGDGLGNVCDICPSNSDLDQADLDGDGSGDACDCEPIDPNDLSPLDVGQLVADAVGGGSIELSWAAANGADAYSVQRGALTGLGGGDYGSCLIDGLTTTSHVDADPAPAGSGWFYLVQPQNYDCGPGGLGFGPTEEPRVSNCVGNPHHDAYPTADETPFGSAQGTVVDLDDSDDQYQTLTEQLSSGGPPANRYSVLEHRWSFQTLPGATVELHVEGLRASSIDNDDFMFEWSDDDGASWNPVTQQSLPLTDDGVDRVLVLPETIAGTLWVRVVDTDHTPGNQALDSLSLDELFVRSAP